jgi:hypothetical protein
MQLKSLSQFPFNLVAPALVAFGLVLCGQFLLDRNNPSASAAPGDRKEALSDADHAKREAALAKALNGPVDVFMDISQLEGGTPTLADVHFVDIVDVTGKDLLRFADNKKHHWLIDPDMVLSFRVKVK